MESPDEGREVPGENRNLANRSDRLSGGIRVASYTKRIERPTQQFRSGGI
ncbi:hypothetical protein RBSWK_06463 [Rhodopirellula baltica SWK14]|uniref:Uncharacterized protein n=1 Tax=Rhodopirellula baltica SWK14 TaxID=993516 RepID=L7C7F4_RHOBT|nr:hypothetical protein RBSWK_06463 [Rhodopirellula baltica SWK14]